MDFLKNPTVLIVGAVAVIAGFILLRNQGSSTNASTTSNNTGSSPVQQGSGGATTTNAQGGTYSYMDGSGLQHIIATDPQGNLVGYASTQPQFGATQSQLPTYIGGMSGVPLVNPYVMSGTPYYSTFDPNQFLGQLSTYTNQDQTQPSATA